MNNEQKIQQLERQVQELLNWKDNKDKQQIQYPIDVNSKKVLKEGLYYPNGKLIPISSYVYSDLLSIGIVFMFNGIEMVSPATSILKTFTAAISDVITSVGHGFQDGRYVAVASTGTLPAGLDEVTPYYVINSTADTFKLSTTLGGGAVDITDAGSGTHYIGNIAL